MSFPPDDDEREGRALSTGSEAVARTLRAHGVRAIFGVREDETLPLVASCAESGIRFLGARDERGAGWMAAGWALATGEAGVLVVSGDAALTNAATPLADCDASAIPLVCLALASENAPRHERWPVARALSSWSARANRPEDSASLVADAFAAATSSQPRVAIVELSRAARDGDGAGEACPPRPAPPQPSDAGGIERARELLAAAQRPVVVAGSGCFWTRAGDSLRALAEIARVPVFTFGAARGLLSDDHDMCFGSAASPAARAAFGDADAVVTVGVDAREDLAIRRATGIEPRPAHVADLGGRARDDLDLLARDAAQRPTRDWCARLRSEQEAHGATIARLARAASAPLHPAHVVTDVAAALPPAAIVCVDGGELSRWTAGLIPARMQAAAHTHAGSALGATGMGCAWAIGMKAAHPDRPVLVLTGDASFGSSALELETAARHGLAVAVVVGRSGRRRARGGARGTPTYDALAEFAGGVGDVVETPAQLAIAVTNALVAPLPSVIDVRVDATVSARRPSAARSAPRA